MVVDACKACIDNHINHFSDRVLSLKYRRKRCGWATYAPTHTFFALISARTEIDTFTSTKNALLGERGL